MEPFTVNTKTDSIWAAAEHLLRRDAAVPLQITAPPNIEGETQLIVRWLVETPAGRVGAWNRASLEYLLGNIPAQAAPAAVAGPDRQTLIDVIAQGLSGTWHCLRVWNAWSFGTMSQDDFVPVDESDTPAELADAVLALLSTAPTTQEAPAAALPAQDRARGAQEERESNDPA
jgi:hypothetical protein